MTATDFLGYFSLGTLLAPVGTWLGANLLIVIPIIVGMALFSLMFFKWLLPRLGGGKKGGR